MGNEQNDTQAAKVDELVVLSKFEGDGTSPDTEFERITVSNGIIVSHDQIENGEIVGPVPNSQIGVDIGRLVSTTKEGVN